MGKVFNLIPIFKYVVNGYLVWFENFSEKSLFFELFEIKEFIGVQMGIVLNFCMRDLGFCLIRFFDWKPENFRGFTSTKLSKFHNKRELVQIEYWKIFEYRFDLLEGFWVFTLPSLFWGLQSIPKIIFKINY